MDGCKRAGAETVVNHDGPLTEPLGTARSGPEHVDQFINAPEYTESERYAAFMLLHFRLPAILKWKFAPYLADKRLYCTWSGSRWRVTGASRMGDVWLASNHERTDGYDKRVPVAECTDWSDRP